VLFRGNAEAAIRRQLVRSGILKGIIGLPANLFYGTGIPACILVLDKENAAARKGIFMIDASKGFIKDGPKNRLREQDLHRIVDTFTRQAEATRGTPAWCRSPRSPTRRTTTTSTCRATSTAPSPRTSRTSTPTCAAASPSATSMRSTPTGRSCPACAPPCSSRPPAPATRTLKLPLAEVKPAILGHPEFTAFNDSAPGCSPVGKKPRCRTCGVSPRRATPRPCIETIAEDLLATFRAAPLLDAYDVYQHLMDYWAETMQDDCYLIAADGWRDAAQPRLLIEDKARKAAKARPDFTLGRKKYVTELIPPALVIRRWFAPEQAAIEKLEADLAALQQQLEEMAEEHGGEEGLLADAANDKGKLTKASVSARLKEVKGETDAAEEMKALQAYLALADQEATTAGKLAEAQDALTAQVAARYPKLTEDEIKALVVEDKWLAALAAAVQGELDRVSQTLTGRIRQLAERYATPLPELTAEVEALAEKVAGHLRAMGFSGPY
jgi:type I restriction enzyme M protein